MMFAEFSCRPGCGACCIAPSIASPMPNAPGGKPAGAPCVNLRADMSCSIHGGPGYPGFCAGLKPDPEMCGASREEAMERLSRMERETDPGSGPGPEIG